MDTIVKKASLSNLGTMHSKKLYIGAVCTLVKSGDIIPMITSVLIPSENEKEYDKQIDDFIKQSK
jgi:NAD-dependent DNA ligase